MNTIISVILGICAILIAAKIILSGPEESKKALEELELITSYANKFVVYARKFMTESSGHEKFDSIVKELGLICDKYNIEMDEDQLAAIVQTAYEAMENITSDSMYNVLISHDGETESE